MYDEHESPETVDGPNPYIYSWPRAFASLVKVLGVCFIVWVIFGGGH